MNYLIYGASVKGPSHIITNIPCQDACAFKIISPSFVIISVADGLGSAINSDVGAKTAVDAVIQFAEDFFTSRPNDEIDLTVLVRESISAARKALERASLTFKCKLRDLACTLISIAIMNDKVAVAHIGDGAVIARNDEGLFMASGPDESEYTNEVKPLTGIDYELDLNVSQPFTGITDVIVISDGCQRAALKKNSEGFLPFEPFCLPLISYFRQVDNYDIGIEALKELLSSNKLCENSDDDKTLVLINIENLGE